MVAARVEQDREAPRIAECDQMRLAGVEVDVHYAVISNGIARHL